MDNLREELYKELERIEEDSLYSMKGHYNAGDWWGKINIFLGIASAIFASIAGLTSLANGYQWIVTVSALVSAVITGISTFLSASEKSQSHKSSGNDFKSIRSDARFLRNINSEILSDKDLIERTDVIRKRNNEINSKALGIPNFAYQKAKKGIEAGEPNYEVDNDN